jgi:hypothetical protein
VTAGPPLAPFVGCRRVTVREWSLRRNNRPRTWRRTVCPTGGAARAHLLHPDPGECRLCFDQRGRAVEQRGPADAGGELYEKLQVRAAQMRAIGGDRSARCWARS